MTSPLFQKYPQSLWVQSRDLRAKAMKGISEEELDSIRLCGDPDAWRFDNLWNRFWKTDFETDPLGHHVGLGEDDKVRLITQKLELPSGFDAASELLLRVSQIWKSAARHISMPPVPEYLDEKDDPDGLPAWLRRRVDAWKVGDKTRDLTGPPRKDDSLSSLSDPLLSHLEAYGLDVSLVRWLATCRPTSSWADTFAGAPWTAVFDNASHIRYGSNRQWEATTRVALGDKSLSPNRIYGGIGLKDDGRLSCQNISLFSGMGQRWLVHSIRRGGGQKRVSGVNSDSELSLWMDGPSPLEHVFKSAQDTPFERENMLDKALDIATGYGDHGLHLPLMELEGLSWALAGGDGQDEKENGGLEEREEDHSIDQADTKQRLLFISVASTLLCLEKNVRWNIWRGEPLVRPDMTQTLKHVSALAPLSHAQWFSTTIKGMEFVERELERVAFLNGVDVPFKRNAYYFQDGIPALESKLARQSLYSLVDFVCQKIQPKSKDKGKEVRADDDGKLSAYAIYLARCGVMAGMLIRTLGEKEGYAWWRSRLDETPLDYLAVFSDHFDESFGSALAECGYDETDSDDKEEFIGGWSVRLRTELDKLILERVNKQTSGVVAGTAAADVRRLGSGDGQPVSGDVVGEKRVVRLKRNL